jgi:ERCC4-type nuclease
MKIIIDDREKNSLVASELINLGAEIEFKHLVLADYIISEEIAVERKTIDDFVSSMINKRIILQLNDMKKNFKRPLLLIEGTEEQDLYRPARHPNMNENAIKGMLLSIMADFQIPIIFSKNYEDSASYLYLLAKREERGKKEFSFKIKRKAFNMKEQQQMIVEGFPGIGPSLSKNILKHFKTIPVFANATIEELEKVPKLGKKKAVSIKALLDKNY